MQKRLENEVWRRESVEVEVGSKTPRLGFRNDFFWENSVFEFGASRRRFEKKVAKKTRAELG